MASHGDRGNNFDGSRNQNQVSISNPVVGQGSSYSITLDEVQSLLEDPGKSLDDVNFDELLNSLWSPEVNTQAVDEQTTQQSGQPLHVLNSSQNPQLSIAQSGNLNKKTVDEVWQDGQQGPDMTLEDFLVKAGVVAESSRGKKHSSSVAGEVNHMVLQQQTQTTQYQIPEIHPQRQGVLLPVLVPHQLVQPIDLMDSSSDLPLPVRRRTITAEAIQMSKERREKRMIKNRESAARSRARKEAHIQELKSKASRLKQEIGNHKQNKEMEKKLLPREPLLERRRLLRRTRSGPI